MKKIVPVIVLIFAVITAAFSLIGLISVAASTVVEQLTVLALPFAIIGFVLSLSGCAFAFLFKKDILCKIALGIDACAFALSLVAVIIRA